MTRTDAFQAYTMGKRNARVWLALGELDAAITQTALALKGLRRMRELGDNRVVRI